MGGGKLGQHSLCRKERDDSGDYGCLSGPLEDAANAAYGMVSIVVIAGSDAQARVLAAPAYARWIETFTFLSRTSDVPPPPNLPMSFEQALDDGFCLVGSPTTVLEALKRQVTEAGVTYVMSQIAFGNLPLAASLQTISFMRSTIMPALRIPLGQER
jgi:alkanesulfonate monooxygenase SsuD/methylene tetrahydromethanopterin reductase-like flavin-dependent oxidoreductase (luciferase family)